MCNSHAKTNATIPKIFPQKKNVQQASMMAVVKNIFGIVWIQQWRRFSVVDVVRDDDWCWYVDALVMFARRCVAVRSLRSCRVSSWSVISSSWSGWIWKIVMRLARLSESGWWNTWIHSCWWNTWIKSGWWSTWIKSGWWNAWINSSWWNSWIHSSVWNTWIKSGWWNTWIKSGWWNTWIKSGWWNTWVNSCWLYTWINPSWWNSWINSSGWNTLIGIIAILIHTYWSWCCIWHKLSINNIIYYKLQLFILLDQMKDSTKMALQKFYSSSTIFPIRQHPRLWKIYLHQN